MTVCQENRKYEICEIWDLICQKIDDISDCSITTVVIYHNVKVKQLI